MKILANGIETTIEGSAGQPVALNIYRLRKQLFDTHHILASVFDVYVGEKNLARSSLRRAQSAAKDISCSFSIHTVPMS